MDKFNGNTLTIRVWLFIGGKFIAQHEIRSLFKRVVVKAGLREVRFHYQAHLYVRLASD